MWNGGDDEVLEDCSEVGASGGGAGDNRGGGGGDPAKGFIKVANPSTTGPQEAQIFKDLDWLKQNADSKCTQWLSGLGDAISGLEGDKSDPSTAVIGHGTFDNITVAAFTGNNPNQTDLPPGYAITVNDAGAFFNGTITSASGQQQSLTVAGYAGGSSQAQMMILLHEFGHLLGAAGFQSDFNNSGAGAANDKLVKQNCQGTLNAAQNIP